MGTAIETRAFTITLGAWAERGVLQQLSILVAEEHFIEAQHCEACSPGVAAGMQSANRSNSTAPAAGTKNKRLTPILYRIYWNWMRPSRDCSYQHTWLVPGRFRRYA